MRNGSIPRSRSSRAAAFVLGAVLAAGVPLTAACTSSSSKPAGQAAKHGPLEQTTLKIGVVKNELGALPVYTGVDQKLFEHAGITVTVDDSYADDNAAMRALHDGKVDMVYGDYADYFVAYSIGHLRSSLIAEGYQAGDGTVLLIGGPDANKSSADALSLSIRTKGILVPAMGADATTQAGTYSVPELMLAAAFGALSNQRFDQNAAALLLHQTPQPKMGDLVISKRADTAVITEPYWSKATNNNHLTTILDLTTGANKGMPLGGYFALQDFSLTHVNLMAAFTQALTQAKEATGDHATAITEMVAHYPIIDRTIATSIPLGVFPTSVNVERLKRVVALLNEWNLAIYFDPTVMVPAGSVGMPAAATAK